MIIEFSIGLNADYCPNTIPDQPYDINNGDIYTVISTFIFKKNNAE